MSGDRATEEISGQGESQIVSYLLEDNWIRFDDGKYINMNNVKSFSVVSKQEREEEQKRAHEENMRLLENFKF
ncbi:hypothetical protein D3C78_1931370 [compost metagenome]